MYLIKINQYEVQQRYYEVIYTARECLALYGVSLPDPQAPDSTLKDTLNRAIKNFKPIWQDETLMT